MKKVNTENDGIIQVKPIFKRRTSHMVFVSLKKERQLGRSQPKAIWSKCDSEDKLLAEPHNYTE